MPKIRELADQFYAYMVGRNRPRTIEYYRPFVERFIAAVGNLDAGELRKHHLLTWGRSWHEMQTVCRLFSWAHVDAELIDRNPFKGIKLPRPGRRRRILTPVECMRLLRATDKTFRPVLFALRESICRPQEVRQVTWECIRWEECAGNGIERIAAGDAWFELAEYKARTRRADPDTPRRIPIPPRLGRLLLRLARGKKEPAGPIFLDRSGRPWSSNAVRLRMRRLREKLKFRAVSLDEAIVAYTLRHTSATNAIAGGMSDRLLAEIMGHTSTRCTARYVHLCLRHLSDAMRAMKKRKG